jgi:hypothetical protein
VDQQPPDIGDGEALASRDLHAREGKQAGHLAGAADEQGHGSAVLAADVDLPFEDEDHVFGGRVLFIEDFAGFGDHLSTMRGKPHAVFEGQSMQWADVVESGCDLFGRSGTGRRNDGGGEHPGTSGVCFSRIAHCMPRRWYELGSHLLMKTWELPGNCGGPMRASV